MTGAETRLVLLLSGGNALGAYQAGAYEAVQKAGLAPDLVVGASLARSTAHSSVAAGHSQSEHD